MNHDGSDSAGATAPSRSRLGSRKPIPLAYLITFTCYGTRLHGDESGSVDRIHNIPGSDFLWPDPIRVSVERKRMRYPLYELDAQRRSVVLETMKEARTYKAWKILAIHVRQTHAHAVVGAQEIAEVILNHFKSYASRALNAARLDTSKRVRWSRHGSTRYLWKPEDVRAAIE